MASRGAADLSVLQRIRIIGAAAWACVALLAPLSAQAAGGAFAVEDAEVEEPGSCKVESWAAFADNRDFLGAVAPACVVSLGRPVELGMTYARFRSGSEWGSELVFKGKTNLIPIEGNKFGLAIIAGGAVDLISREFSAAFVTIPVSFQLHEQFRLNVNAGWLGNPTTNEHSMSWGVGAEWEFAKQLKLIGEVFGFVGESVNRDPRAQVGLRFTPQEHYDIDLIYGRNITGENANWITVGLNVRFDANGGK